MATNRTKIQLAVGLALAGCAPASQPIPASDRRVGTASASVSATPDQPAETAAAPISPVVELDEAFVGEVGDPVLLLGSPGVEQSEPVRFQPIACAVKGKLRVGKVCAGALGDQPQVSIVGGSKKVSLLRKAKDFEDENGGRLYKAPLAPACCMYNTCIGETVAYLPPSGMATGGPMVAVSPAGADVKLAVPAPKGGALKGSLPWLEQGLVTDQWVAHLGRRVATVSREKRAMEGAFWFSDSEVGPWQQPRGPEERHGMDHLKILALTDLDGNGQPEVLLYEQWANDFGIVFYGNEWVTPAYQFSCGNI